MGKFHEYFHAPPRHPFARNLYWKYGFFVVGGVLLIFNACFFAYLRVQGPGITYGNLIVSYNGLILPLILIFNHLSSFFYFGPRFTLPFRVFSALFLLFGSAWIFGSAFLMIRNQP